MTLKKKPFENFVGKRKKCWKPAFAPLPTMFSTLLKTNFIFSAKFNLSDAKSQNLDQSKNLLLGKEFMGEKKALLENLTFSFVVFNSLFSQDC